MLDAYIFAGLRTPFGRHGEALAPIRPDDLAAHVIRQLLARYDIPGEAIEDVILGNTNQAGEDSRNIARHAALLAGLPVTVPGQTINRLCASGLAAVIDAARAVTCGEGDLFVAGGVESMSRAPFVMAKAEAAYSRDSLPNMAMTPCPRPAITSLLISASAVTKRTCLPLVPKPVTKRHARPVSSLTNCWL
jgi:acetyl-CoA acetyltransferase